MKPICVGCKQFYRAKKNGVYFEEGMPGGGTQSNALLPGQECTPGREDWGPYKLWVGDLYECPGCGAQIITGVARDPIAEHYQPEYAGLASRFNPTLRINDC